MKLSPHVCWAIALAISFLIQLRATLRGGYIGPDYPTHLARLIEWRKIFDFSTTSPPAYYLLGHLFYLVIGARNAFPITLSIIQSGSNAFALWWLFNFTERWFASRLIHLACVLFLTFLPPRLIHDTTLGTDCVTIPLFLLLVFVLDPFRIEQTSTKNAVIVGVALSLAIFSKYSFISAIPVILLLLLVLAKKRRWQLNRLFAFTGLALGLPVALSFYSFWASSRVHGYNTEKHWRQAGMPADMDYGDLFSVKTADVQLFKAPEYFKKEILVAHAHSYIALAHLGIFTDTMNLFQRLTVPQRIESVLIPDQKKRAQWKTSVMRLSMAFGVLWTTLALIATPWSFIIGVRRLLKDELRAEDLFAFFGLAFFLLMFLPIPFVQGGALFGYWTPRLILPSLVYFSVAIFLFIEKTLAARSEAIPLVLLTFVVLQCATEGLMLV
jgi:4-amino-4-deoxy-L-arabinose transferase-like glycosyltransferase